MEAPLVWMNEFISCFRVLVSSCHCRPCERNLQGLLLIGLVSLRSFQDSIFIASWRDKSGFGYDGFRVRHTFGRSPRW